MSNGKKTLKKTQQHQWNSEFTTYPIMSIRYWIGLQVECSDWETKLKAVYKFIVDFL